jgi:hypothetical protein
MNEFNVGGHEVHLRRPRWSVDNLMKVVNWRVQIAQMLEIIQNIQASRTGRATKLTSPQHVRGCKFLRLANNHAG